MSTRTQVVRERAAQLLEKSGAWAQRSSAYDSLGNSVAPTDPAACAWCMLGAIDKVCADELIANVAISELHCELNSSVARFNDAPGRTQAEVVAALRGGVA